MILMKGAIQIMKLIDSHCHLTTEEYKEEFNEILEDTKKNLEFIINIGCDLESSQETVKLSKNYDFMFASVGIHPNYANKYDNKNDLKLINMIKEKKVIAIGECGLDYYRDITPKNLQNEIFKKQLNWSKEFNKPLIIHGREAYEDIIDILSLPEYKDLKGVMHSFAGSYEQVEKILDRFYCSISGIVTFKNALNIQEMVKKIPLERLMVETDAPYLAPHPFRGKINKPSYITYTAQKIAEIKNATYDKVIEITNKNTKELFNI